MLKVVSVSDKVGTAIDRLCRGTAKHNQNIEYVVCDVHPKRPDDDQLSRFVREAETADVIDYQYFKSADMLRERFEWLKDIPSILTHNNPYSIHDRDWNDYDLVVANNLTMQKDLSHITTARLEYIPLTIDLDFWKFNNDWKPEKQVLMVANRIEGKKGILEVALACAELGVKFVLVGAISDGNYFNDILATSENVEFYEQITDEQLRDLYYNSMLHVCNSQDNFESGTLPILEAMACGVPVLTRSVGHVPDLNNGHNMFINERSNEDVMGLIEQLKTILDSDLEEVRQKAWNTVKSRNNERRAYAYQKLYRDLVSEKQTVSVIMPIYKKPEITKSSLQAVAEQTYKDIELIIVNDGDRENDEVINEFKKLVKFPVRVIENNQNDYGLARARNKGVIEATGEILVFCDQRMKMNKKAIEHFVENLQSRTWVYGSKGVKKEFVENFSAIYREDLIRIGMFNERMDRYGGLSQETRSRAKYNGYKIEYVEKATAEPQGKSSNKYNKREDIIAMKNALWKMGFEL